MARGHHTTPQSLEGSGVSLGSLLVGWFGGGGLSCDWRVNLYWDGEGVMGMVSVLGNLAKSSSAITERGIGRHEDGILSRIDF